MFTVPEVTGVPLAATLTVRGCTHPLRVPAVSVVVVDAPMAYASWGAASAIINPATNTSREPRQFMPLTCTCSKDQNRVPPACRSPEPIVSGGADRSQPAEGDLRRRAKE